ncbi:MAG TPA: MCP four helix bundle domain-containing protein, partial [Candidatus Krumholzibacteriaceae bacterium]
MKIGLSTKTTATLMCLVLTAVVGSSIALVYAWQEKHMMDEMVSANVGDVVAMAELDISLLKQKGYVASYILDKGNKNWTEELDRFEPQLRDRLNRMEASSGDQEDRVLIRKVHDAFDRYTARRHEIVSLYDTGDTGAAVKAYLGELNETYFEAITASDSLLAVNKRQILRSLADERREIRRLTAVMVSTGTVVAVLGFALVWLLFHQIFIPLRRIAMDLGAFSGGAEHSSGDDLASLHYHMRALLD